MVAESGLVGIIVVTGLALENADTGMTAHPAGREDKGAGLQTEMNDLGEKTIDPGETAHVPQRDLGRLVLAITEVIEIDMNAGVEQSQVLELLNFKT